MFRKVKISERLPEINKWVTTIDSVGEHRVYRLVDVNSVSYGINGILPRPPKYSWIMRDVNGTDSPDDNLELVYWLEEIESTEWTDKVLQDAILASPNKENFSDGYHTFKELYEFRKLYNAALFNEWAKHEGWNGQVVSKYNVHKSWKHHDGELCFGGGWFIVVAILPTGQISNHYEAKDWDLFKIPETEKALYPFDGHTSKDVAMRLEQLCKKDNHDKKHITKS